MTGFVDSVTLHLSNIGVRKAGKVKKVITLGQYRLAVVIKEVTGRLTTGSPQVAFGGNEISLRLPVKLASGTGDAHVDFEWEGKSIGGAVCGDIEVKQDVRGSVKPAEYPVSGALELTATSRQILASPRFPLLKVNLKVEPSRESWAAVQRILDAQTGLCGFVVDVVDIKGVLEGLLAKGFDVKLPTNRIKPMAIPVGIAPTMTVRGAPVRIGVEVGRLAITEQMIWLGADVTLGGPRPIRRRSPGPDRRLVPPTKRGRIDQERDP